MLKQLRRGLFTLAALGAVVSGILVAGVSPASASVSPAASTCTPTLPWKSSAGKTEVDVYCGGGNVPTLVAEVTVTRTGSGTWRVWVFDIECDNKGPYWHAHQPGGGQYRLGTGGCGTSETYEFGPSSIGSPKNWWVEFAGHNSAALSFP